MSINNPVSVGLGGDGDEIEAMEDVERAFRVKLDDTDAPHWETAGDVFESLLRALPEEQRQEADLWERYAEALCGVSGVDPKTIEPGSPLLSDNRFWARLADASAIVWIVMAGLLILIAGFRLLGD